MAEISDTKALVPSRALPNLKELSNALDAVVDWHTLGIKLGVRSYELHLIENNYPHDGTRCKSEMLACCLRSGNPPTWKKVVGALCRMGEHQSAYKIRRKHLKGLRIVHSHKDRTIQMRKHSSTYKIRRKRLETLKGLRAIRFPEDKAVRTRKHKSAYKTCRKRLKSMKGLTVARASEDCVLRLTIENLQAIKGKFASLLALADSRLQGKSISMRNLRVFLAALYSPDDDSNDARAIDPSYFLDEVMGAAQDLGEILVEMSKRGLMNFKNIHTLRSIVAHYAKDDQELMEKVEEYGEELAGFALVTKMQDYLDAEPQQCKQSEHDKLLDDLTVKVRGNVTERTLQYVSDLWDSLARQLKLPQCSMLFDKVAEGCIEISWLLPSHLTIFATRRAQESTEYFIQQRLLQVTIAGRCIFEVGAENITGGEKNPERKGDPDEGDSGGLQTSHKEEHLVHENVSEETDPGTKERDPDVGNLEDPQAAGDIHEEEPLLVENVSKVKDPNGGRPADHDDGNLPLPEVFEDPTNVEHKDEPETLPEHELRLRSAMVISSNYSLLWQYLDPSQLLPTLLEKFLITEEKKKEAESYSRYAQTSIILRGIFDDYCPANRIYKLCDTLETLPGQEHLGRKLLQDCKHPSPLSAYSRFPSIPATHSDFSDISQQFQQLELEAIDLLDQFPNALAKLKQVIATLVFPHSEGKMVPLIDPCSYENALTVRELFRLLAHHWNPLSIDLLGLLLEASGCSMAATKLAEFVEARDSKAHLVLCVRQMPSLVHFQSVHRAPLSKLQSLHHSLFVQLPNRRVTSSQNTIRISVEVDTNLVCLADYERITTVLSGLFWMPKAAFVFAGVLENSSVLCWLTFPEFLACSYCNITDISGCRLLAETGITRIAVGGWFYQCPTIKEVELWEASCYELLDAAILLTNSDTNVNVATLIGVTPLFIASWKGHHDIVECLLRANADVNLQDKTGASPLLIACQENHGEIVDRLLIAKADVNLQTKIGVTPLFIASWKGHREIVECLLTANADVNLQINDGASPLYVACQENHGEIVDRLLIAKADVNLQKKDGTSPLYMACQENHGEIVDRLLKAKADVNVQEETGATPLFVTCGKGHAEIVDRLLTAKADVNLQRKDGTTPLFMACQNNFLDIVDLLLKAKADVNLQQNTGASPLYVACQNNHGEIVDRLLIAKADVNLQAKDGGSPLFMACQENHGDIVDRLLIAKADVNLPIETGETPLYVACSEGHAEIVDRLLTAKADVNLQRKDGFTPLMVASSQGHPSVVRLLLPAGATVNTTNQDGETALHAASWDGHVEIVELLIAAKADVNLQQENGETALMVASTKGHPSVVRILLQAGATVNSATQNGLTALHFAAAFGHEDVLKVLLEANMDPDVKDKNGVTALMWASAQGHPSMVRVLLQAGATVNSAAKNGLTALHTAAACGREDVLKVLDPDVNEKDGVTDHDLMAASGKGHPSVVRVLLQAGSTVNSAAQGQETALMAAAREGSVEIARLLIRHGASVNLTNEDGLTAFDLASLKGHAEVCQELLTPRPRVADGDDEPQPSQPFEWTED